MHDCASGNFESDCLESVHMLFCQSDVYKRQLLSQVDSSIGGKTGVDFDQYKNMVGAFHMPRLVYICLLYTSKPDDQTD